MGPDEILQNTNGILNTPDNTVRDGLNGLYNEPDTSIAREQLAQIVEFAKNLAILDDIFKFLGILVTLVLIGLFLWLFAKRTKEVRERIRQAAQSFNPPKPGENSIKARWEEVLRHLNSFREGEWKFAIIEADKLIFDVLEEANFPGETMGDKLESISSAQLRSVNQLKEAHRLRNLIVHNTTFKAKYTEVRYAIDQYEKVLKELRLLE